MGLDMEQIDNQKHIAAKKEALGIRDALWFLYPPINPIEIAEAKGIDVIFATFAKKHSQVSSLYSYKNNTIYVNKAEQPSRQVFAIAHELGHKILHEEWAKSENYQVLLREQLEFPGLNNYEEEANIFASHLLIPDSFINKYRNIASIDELARVCMVPKSIIRKYLGSFA